MYFYFFKVIGLCRILLLRRRGHASWSCGKRERILISFSSFYFTNKLNLICLFTYYFDRWLALTCFFYKCIGWWGSIRINSKKKKNTPLFYIHLYSGTELLLDLGSGPPDFFFLIFTIYIYNLLFLAICFNKIDLSPLNIIIDIFKSYKYYPNNKN